DAGCALLPPWARGMYGLHEVDRRRDAVLLAALRPNVALLRWALRDGVAAQARQRLSAVPAPTTIARPGT
ncbi:MAG: histidine kinase, partial [Pseudomonadota bacterium]|nr:histidine kinase [Pseudomonadota bacterium]